MLKKTTVNPSESKFSRNVYIRDWFVARHIRIRVFGNIDLLRSSQAKTIEHGLAYDLSINENAYGNDNMEYSIRKFIMGPRLVMRERKD